MPNAVIQAASERSGISVEKLEEIWQSVVTSAKEKNIDNPEAYANAAVQNATQHQAHDSNRLPDHNNFLHVKECVLTGEEVADYLGKEIAGYDQLGIAADDFVGIYRPLEELEKAKDTFNNLPLTDGHIQITPEKPATNRIIGSTGTDATIKDGKLYNSLAVWTAKAQQQIQSADRGIGGQKDLSCGYLYDLVPEEGNFKGKPYKFKMINIRGNHVALVPEGRNPDAMIADQKPKTGETKLKKPFSVFKLVSSIFAGDKKAYDRSRAMDALCEIGKKAADEFEGGEIEKAKMIVELAEQIREHEEMEQSAGDGNGIPQNKSPIMDNENSEDPKKGQNGSDNDPPEETPEEKERKTKEAADAAVRVRTKAISLSSKLVGKLSDQFLADSSPEQIIDNALTKNKIAIDGKSFDTKLAIAEALAQHKPSAIPRIAIDNKPVPNSEYKSILPNKGDK